MTNERSGFAVLAAMLGVDAGVLRAIADPWNTDAPPPPMNPAAFIARVIEARDVAAELNNTNAWEMAIRTSMDEADIPVSLPTAGVPRLVVHEGGKGEAKE